MPDDKLIIEKRALIGDLISEISWISPDIVYAQSGKQIDMGQIIKDDVGDK